MKGILTEKSVPEAFGGYLCMDAGDILVEKLPGPDPGRLLQVLLDRDVIGPDENE